MAFSLHSSVRDPFAEAAPTTLILKTEDLLPSEVAFVAAMQQLGFGLFQDLQIRSGELVLNPGPVTVRHVKFGTPATTGKTSGRTTDLRQQIAEFFAYVREVDAGEIRTLEIRHGLPFSIDVVTRWYTDDGSGGAGPVMRPCIMQDELSTLT